MGFYVPEPEARFQPLPDVVGPQVHLRPCSGSKWCAHVSVVARHTELDFSYTIGDSGEKRLSVEEFGHEGDWHFLRWYLEIDLDTRALPLKYKIRHSSRGDALKEATIPLPGSKDEWNCFAYSCYDQRRAIGEVLWADATERMKSGKRLTHAILGGGDQIYNDNVWNEEPMKHYLGLPKEERLKYDPPKEMSDAAHNFYLYSYLRFLHFHPGADFLAATPQVNTWDDHDIFDGYGSYPDELQKGEVFRVLFTHAQHFYLLFQQATNAKLAERDGYYLGASTAEHPFTAFHFQTMLGPSLAVVCPDTRSQRTMKRIVTLESMGLMKRKMREFPQSLRHIIMLAASPVLYPSLGIVENLLKLFQNSKGAKYMLGKTGLYDNVMNAFGEPNLLDDVTDHWSSSAHEDEKAELVGALHEFSKERTVRSTIVSGDVHLACFTFAHSADKTTSRYQVTDPGCIPQIVTSGIGNEPPGNSVVKYIETCVKKNKPVAPGLQETVTHIFKNKNSPTGSHRFNNRQNYCEISVLKPDSSAPPDSPGPMEFTLVMIGGDPIQGKEIGDRVTDIIPPLLKRVSPSEGLAHQMSSTPAKKKGCLCC